MNTELPSFKLIDTFAAVAQYGSIERAAVRLDSRPTTVSHQLKQLEDQLGIDVFDRSTRPMQLTKRGELFLRSVLEIRAQYREIVNGLYTNAPTRLRHLSLGIIDDFNSSLTPSIAAQLRELLPHTNIKVHSGRSDGVLKLLQNRKVDAAVTAEFPQQTNELITQGLVKEKLILIHAHNDHISKLTGDALVEALSQTPYISYEPESPLGRLIMQHLKRLRITSHAQCVFDNNRSIFELVRRLGGWAITTPLNLIEEVYDSKDFVVRELPFTGVSRTLWFLCTDELATIPSGKGGLNLDRFVLCLLASELRSTIVPRIFALNKALDTDSIELLTT